VTLAGYSDDPETARAGLNDPIPAIRAAALGALSRLGALDPPALTSGLSDPDPFVRRRASELAADAADEAVVPALVDLLNDTDTGVVEAAAWALGERGEGGAVDALSSVVTGHDDPLCREAAVAALGAIADRRGLAAILAACHDKPAIRRRAVLALAPFDGDDVDAALADAARDRDWQVRQAAEDLLGRS
jgi:HEAT repeat protein